MNTPFKLKPLIILSLILMSTLVLAETIPQQQIDFPEQQQIKIPVQQQNIQNSNFNMGNRGQRSGAVNQLALDHLKPQNIKIGDLKGWKIHIPGGHPLATPAIMDGQVYIGGGFGSYEFYSFDSQKGTPKWAIRVSDDGPTAAVAADGTVTFNTESCTLFVVNSKTGDMIWSKWLGDPLMSQPAVKDGMVYMAYPTHQGHQLTALTLKEGKEKWRAPIAGDIISAPIAIDDSIYISTFDGTVYHFDAKEGTQLWTKNFRATSSPWLYDGKVLVAQREEGKDGPDEGVARLSGKTGVRKQKNNGNWRTRKAPYLDKAIQGKSNYNTKQIQLDQSVGFGLGMGPPPMAKAEQALSNVGQGTVYGLWEYQGSRPVVYKEKLFLTQGDEVVALNPEDGKEFWATKLGGDLEKVGGHLAAPPSPAGNKLYVATVEGNILVLDQATGELEKKIAIGTPMRFQPALSGGWLYVGTTTGELIALDLNDSSADHWTMWGGSPSHNGPQK